MDIHGPNWIERESDPPHVATHVAPNVTLSPHQPGLNSIAQATLLRSLAPSQTHLGLRGVQVEDMLSQGSCFFARFASFGADFLGGRIREVD